MSETENRFTLGSMVGQWHPARLRWCHPHQKRKSTTEASVPPVGGKDSRLARVGGYRR